MKKILFVFLMFAGLLASRAGFAQTPSCPQESEPYSINKPPGSSWGGGAWHPVTYGGCTVLIFVCERILEDGSRQYAIRAIKTFSSGCTPTTAAGMVSALEQAGRAYLLGQDCSAYPTCPSTKTNSSVVIAECWQKLSADSDEWDAYDNANAFCVSWYDICCDTSTIPHHVIVCCQTQNHYGSASCTAAWNAEEQPEVNICYDIHPCNGY